MKVKLEIEFEMETGLEEPGIVKTKVELLKGIRLTDCEAVNGFEITTDFDDCDNTADFFIKPNSTKIISIKTPEFNKEELWVNDIELNDNYDGVSCQFATHFDPDEKFGTHINGECDSWVNFYAEYVPKSKELKCEYYVSTPTREESHPYYPTEIEKELIINAMEQFSQDNYGENLMEFIQNEKEEITMDMGGIQ